EGVIVLFPRLGRAAQKQIRGGGPGSRPAPLNQRGDPFGLRLVLGLLKTLEKLIEGGRGAAGSGGGRRARLLLAGNRGSEGDEGQAEQKRKKTHGGNLSFPPCVVNSKPCAGKRHAFPKATLALTRLVALLGLVDDVDA